MLISVCLFIACQKQVVNSEKMGSPAPKGIPLPLCTHAPSYGNTILSGEFNTTNDYIVLPVNNPGTGTYIAKPAGLLIDPNTGAINVSKSEVGVKYAVGFALAGTTDTCYTNITLAGINYVDSVYVLSKNDTLARPIYNALPGMATICDESNDKDYPPSGGGKGKGNEKCEFDVKVKINNAEDDDDKDEDDEDNDDGDDDKDDEDDDDGDDDDEDGKNGKYYTANSQKLRVRTISGIINLKKSLSAGVFGKNPINGISKEIAIYYKLNDNSKKSLRKIIVKLIYYRKKSEIPVELLTEISSKRQDFLEGKPLMMHGRPRPPLIVITRDLQ